MDRNPWAPACKARAAKPVWSFIEKTRMRAPGAASRRGATRSRPPMPGRLMSSTIRSGASPPDSCASASSPDMAWPIRSYPRSRTRRFAPSWVMG